MKSRLPTFSLAILLLAATAACDTRVPPTQRNPTGDPMMTASCPAGQTCPPEEHSFLHRVMPWNWF